MISECGEIGSVTNTNQLKQVSRTLRAYPVFP